MNVEDLREQLDDIATEETKEQVEKAFKVVKIMERKLKSLEKTDYLPDEIVLGTALALNKMLADIDNERKEKLKGLSSRIIGM